MTRKSGLKGDSLTGGLTERETQVLRLVERGFKNKQIAAMLGIAPGTVGRHLQNIFKRLRVSSRTEAAFVGLKQYHVVPDVASRRE